jgi:hypothetical protein
MSRLNQIMGVILVLQLVAVAVIYWPDTSVASGEPLFEGVEADQIVALTISDANGQSVQLAKGPTGWGLPDAGGFPVEEPKVEELLRQIAALRADRLVTRTADSHKRLEVDDAEFERLIEFELADGTRHKLYLGSSPSFNIIHVRADDEDEVYLSLGLATSDAGTTAVSWIDPIYLSMPQADIVAISLENKNGSLEFEKGDDDAWIMVNLPAGETLLENNVSSLATRISSLRMTRPLGQEEDPAYGFDNPSAKVTAVTRDAEGNEKTYVLRVGASLEGEGGYVVKSVTSPYYVLMSTFTVEDFVEGTLQDYLQAPPTPTPEAQEPTPTP